MRHIPVMLDECLEIFKEKRVARFFDATLGAGGFAKVFLEQHPEVETYFGCDQDEEALEVARESLKEADERVEFIHSNFRYLDEQLKRRGVEKVDGFFLT
jgi:16S rRNA (cytosine1402-N4)-methyltransferase